MGSGVHDERYRLLIERLREARDRQKITQAELASKLGRSQQFVSKYESRERRLDIVECLDIASALNMLLTDLLNFPTKS